MSGRSRRPTVSWHWVADRQPDDPTLLDRTFPTQGEAESWLGEFYPGLVDPASGGQPARGDRVVYGPMSLEADRRVYGPMALSRGARRLDRLRGCRLPEYIQ